MSSTHWPKEAYDSYPFSKGPNRIAVAAISIAAPIVFEDSSLGLRPHYHFVLNGKILTELFESKPMNLPRTKRGQLKLKGRNQQLCAVGQLHDHCFDGLGGDRCN